MQSQERQVLPRTTHAGTLSAQVFLLLRRLHNRGSGQLSLPSGGRLKRGPARVCWAPSGLRLVAAAEPCLWAEGCSKSVAPALGHPHTTLCTPRGVASADARRPGRSGSLYRSLRDIWPSSAVAAVAVMTEERTPDEAWPR